MIKHALKAALWRMGYQISRVAPGALPPQQPSGLSDPPVREPKVPHGHYYSPYPDLHKIESRKDVIFDRNRTVLDIDLNEGHQLQLLNAIFEMAKDVDIPVEQTSNAAITRTTTGTLSLTALCCIS